MGLSRSQQMARIRGKNTSPERLLRTALWRQGLRYRTHYRIGSTRPDLSFCRHKTAVFIDGCFWHGCPDHYVRPRTREDFWREKLVRNLLRDRRQTCDLERMGWRVCHIWEHSVVEDVSLAVRQVRKALEAKSWHRPASWRVTAVEVVEGVAEMERRYLVRLENPASRREVVRPRSTAKWSRSKRPLASKW